MSKQNRLAFYDAIIEYGISGKEPQDLNKTVLQCWLLVKPQLDSNNKKYEDGKKGGGGLQKPVVYRNKKPPVCKLKNPM